MGALLPDAAVPSDKRARIQTYLDPEIAELIRKRAEEEDRPESREVSRLVKLGLEADAKNYILGDRAFRTKADVAVHVRSVRDAAVLGEPVTDSAVLALLRLHPEWEEKTAGGGWVGTALIEHPAKLRATKEIAICFYGSDRVVDISWTKLIPLIRKGFNGPIASWDSRLSELRLAARQEVEEQVAPLRRKGCEVDHVYPLTFDRLLHDWLVSAHLVVDDVPVSSGTGTDTSRRFADVEQGRAWAAYHQAHAVLECLSYEEHAKRSSRAQLDWAPLL